MNRDLDFLYEIGSLFNIQRGWRQHLGMDCATIPEHLFRVAWIAMVLARMEGVQSDEKILKMALVHDIAEVRTSDLSYVQKGGYVQVDDVAAAHDTFENTSIIDFEEILKEYDRRDSIEAKIVKDADNLDLDIEMKELQQRGSQIPQKWQHLRQHMRDEKLYTESAKKLWDDIQNSDPDHWHVSDNKWLKIPNTGR